MSSPSPPGYSGIWSGKSCTIKDESILSFTTKFITKPRYSPVLIGVADKLCDIYSGVVGQSENIDEYFDKLRRHVKDECRTQKSLLRLIGQIDAVMCAGMQADNDSD